MNIFDLISQDVTLRRVSNRDGGEWAGPCPLCRGTDRFRVWPNSSRNVKFWCRQCPHFSGDIISYLRKKRGLTFQEAAAIVGKELPETDRVRHARERAVKERILTEYWQWYHRQLRKWPERLWELRAEIETAEIGYRHTVLKPYLYTEAEQEYWSDRLATLSHELPQVEHTCDILTYDSYEKERFDWWQTESHTPLPPLKILSYLDK